MVQDNQPDLLPTPQPVISPEQIARKEEYRRRLALALKDPAFRQIEGFPLGSDEDILALSDPPYYTACPNPFLPEILSQWQAERRVIRRELGLPEDENQVSGYRPYRREPFAADVSEGRGNPIYNAHSYHTKVPHKAIMRYILHYTDPGDIVFDGFCGTGMTGVAAQLCGNKKAIEELGYKVKANGVILDANGIPTSRLSARRVVLNDLSPAATFIAYNYNTPVDARAFEREAQLILKKVETEYGWMYETWHSHCDDPQRVKGKINYVVWSDVFVCPQCGKEMVFWDVAIDKQKGEISDSWNCPNCGEYLAKSPKKDSGAIKVLRAWETHFDRALGQPVRQAKQVPVLVNYSQGRKRYDKKPDSYDIEIIQRIEVTESLYPVPSIKIPKGDKTSDPFNLGITHIHQFYTRRNLLLLSAVMTYSQKRVYKATKALTFWLSAALRNLSKLSKLGTGNYFHGGGGAINAGILGTLYIPSFSVESCVTKTLNTRLSKLALVFSQLSGNYTNLITTQSTSCGIEEYTNAIDYIFVDPPFGGNLMYSELNLLWEAWLGVVTNNHSEAIINKTQHKGLPEYQALMEACFSQFYRILKHSRWMTVEFHNSQNAVWNAIQEAILRAGFMLADVRTLNKEQGSFNQVTTSAAVKQDLIISAYKPSAEFIQRFSAEGSRPAGVWDFTEQHLTQLPLPTTESGLIEIQQERLQYLLYDRMIAFYLVRGLAVPLSAADFYLGLANRYLERDNMYFTSTQAAEYDRLRMQSESVQQLALFVNDEKSAIQWLRQELDPDTGHGPKTYGDLMPRFLEQLHQSSHEALPELKVLLEQNYIQDETERWYVPNPDRKLDLEKLRSVALIREFSEYRGSKGKLKVFRGEAVRAGFSQAWKEHQYRTIIEIAERMPEQVLQEDSQLALYYHNALGRDKREPSQGNLL